MIITFPDGTLYDSAGAAGTLTFNSTTPAVVVGTNAIYPTSPATITSFLWSRLQSAITAAARSGVQTLSFYPPVLPVIASASPSAFGYADMPIIVLTGTGFQPGMTGGVDYAGINGSGLPFVPVAITVASQTKAWFTCPNLNNNSGTLIVTVMNQDGGVAVFSGFTVS